jgi:hypothetical protein
VINVVMRIHDVFDIQPMGGGFSQKPIVFCGWVNEQSLFFLFVGHKVAEDIEVPYFELFDKHSVFSGLILI